MLWSYVISVFMEYLGEREQLSVLFLENRVFIKKCNYIDKLENQNL